MLRMFKDLKLIKAQCYRNEEGDLKINDTEDGHNNVVSMVKALAGNEPDITLKFKNGKFGAIYYKKDK